MVVTDMLRCATRGPEVSLHPPLGDQLERGLLVQSANQIMIAASATRTSSRMIRCMATSRQKIPLPHMLPEDKDSAYAVLWPLVDPLKKRAASDKG